jgi:acyl-CoA synthetase (AMP-forming)/AMP-acid ligase II
MTNGSPENEAVLRRHWYAAGHWRPESLWESIAKAGAGRGAAVALRDESGAVDWTQLLHRALIVSAGLGALGVHRGEAVMIQSRNRAEAVIAMLACFAGGYLCIPVPPLFAAAQLVAIAGAAGARCFIELDDEHGAPKLAAVGSALPGLITIAPDAFARRLEAGAPATAQPLGADEPCFVLYSSGSTGNPKGVLHSGNSLRFSAETVARHHGVGPADRVLVGMEFGFVGSTVLSVMLALLAGAGMTLMPQWSAAQALETIARQKITYTLLLSAHVVDLLRSPALGSSEGTSLRRAILAGLNEDQRRETMARLCPRPLPMYGMSESIGHTTCEAGDPLDAILSTDGRAIAGTEIELRDESGAVVPPGVTGDVHLRGPNRCLGYFNAPQLTAQSIGRDGFLRTGDRAVLDRRGFMTFQARAKEIIRRGGVTIIPGEVEALLRSHPDVVDVALVAVPDERLGEKSCACVIPRQGSTVTLASLTAHLERLSVARYLWPEYAVTMRAFPRTVSLKVRRADLAAEAQAALASGQAAPKA